MTEFFILLLMLSPMIAILVWSIRGLYRDWFLAKRVARRWERRFRILLLEHVTGVEEITAERLEWLGDSPVYVRREFVSAWLSLRYDCKHEEMLPALKLIDDDWQKRRGVALTFRKGAA